MRFSKQKVEIQMARTLQTRKNLQEKTGLSEMTVARAVRGAACHPRSLGLIAEALRSDVADLVDWDNLEG